MAEATMQLTNAIVLVTRAQPGAEEFVTALRAVSNAATKVVTSPVFDFENIPFDMPDLPFRPIFTSARAVSAVPPQPGQRAYCVGPRTARAARTLGFDVIDSNGNVDDLEALILSEKPTVPLVHIRGEVTAGRLAGRLAEAGLGCSERIGYRKQQRPLTTEAWSALTGKDPVLLPLFSAESVAILASNGPFMAPLHCVAISAAVAEAARVLAPQSMTVAAQPNGASLVACVAGLIA